MKKLHICFSNFKYCLPTIAPPAPSSPNNSHHPCRHHRRRSSPSTSFFVNSLYVDNDVNLITTTTTAAAPTNNYHDNLTITTTNSSSESDDDRRTVDFSAVLASKRFFVDSSPGESNSIVDSVPNSPKPKTKSNIMVASSGAVAIHTYSPDPYTDFRRSMQEMFEAHKSIISDQDDDDDWDHYLRELLNCYLSLNPKPNHNFIIRAFSDLLVSHLLLLL